MTNSKTLRNCCLLFYRCNPISFCPNLNIFWDFISSIIFSFLRYISFNLCGNYLVLWIFIDILIHFSLELDKYIGKQKRNYHSLTFIVKRYWIILNKEEQTLLQCHKPSHTISSFLYGTDDRSPKLLYSPYIFPHLMTNS